MHEAALVAGAFGSTGLALGALGHAAARARARRRLRRALASASPPQPTVRLPAWLAGVNPLPEAAVVPRPQLQGSLVTVTIGVLMACVAAGPVGGLLGLVVAAGTVLWWCRNRRRQAWRDYERALPGWLAALARSLRSGATLRAALGDASRACEPPLRLDVCRLHALAIEGDSLGDGLRGWASSRPLPAVRLVAAALAIGERTGGLDARSVDDLALTVRARLDGRAEVWALTAQVRASAATMVVAPLGFLVLVAWSDPSVRTFLTHSAAGWSCLVGGLLLDALAAWLMARMMRSFG